MQQNTTLALGHQKFVIDKTLTLRAKGFINGKFSLTSDSDHIFVVRIHLIAVVYIIYVHTYYIYINLKSE